MRAPSPFRRLAWFGVPLLAMAFITWMHWQRADRVVRVSALAGWSVDAPRTDSKSATGWEAGRRNLLLTQPFEEAHEWIAQTQQMLATADLRVREVDYDNAPFGRPALAASAYRWWLGGLAWCDSLVTDVPVGRAVERTALYANPLLQVLLLLGSLPLVVRWLGQLAGMLFTLGLACLYPMAGCFAPGLPGAGGLALACAVWTILPLLFIGPRPTDGDNAPPVGDAAVLRSDRRWFATSGVAGALGLWVDVTSQVPVLCGVALGALLAAFLARGRNSAADPLLSTAGWRLWGLSTGGGALVLYLIDYFPLAGGPYLEVLHPVYGFLAAGLGALLGYVLPWLAGRGRPSEKIDYAWLAAGGLATAAAPVALALTGSAGFLATGLGSTRLSDLPEGITAPDLGTWLINSGMGTVFWGTVLPLLGLVGLGAFSLWRGPAARRTTLALALGPAVVFAGLACRHLSLFSQLGCTLLLTGLAAIAAPSAAPLRWRHWVLVAVGLGLLLPGARLLLPASLSQSANEPTEFELPGILERDLAHWLSTRAPDGQAVVLAPPDLASALSHYGGLRAVNSLAWENKDGFLGAVRLARASTREESWALIQARGVTHIVLPSWNHLLDDYLGAGQNGRLPPDCFLSLLRNWNLPPWLQPLAYPIPASAGFPGESVMVLAVVEEQDEAPAAARLAEYFAENALREPAAGMVDKLRQFPGDPGALAALAQVQRALGDRASLDASLAAIESLLSAGADADLAWDRRLSLSFVLMLARHNDPAQRLFAGCFAELDEAKLRSLSPAALMRFLALAKHFKLEIEDAHLRALAPRLLPPSLRSRL